MRAKDKLTHNAIMYASVGFQQDCLLQVLNVRPGPNSSLEMVVYDGTVYAGAHYTYSTVQPANLGHTSRQNHGAPALKVSA